MSNFFLNRYLEHSLKREIIELYTSIAIRNFAFSMIAIFEPVYLYKLYGSISIVLLYYAVAYTIYLFTVSFGAKAAARYGFEHCIFYSVPFAILYFLSLSQVPSHGWLIFFAILFFTGYKILFWPSYHTDFAHYSKSGYKGRELSILSLTSTIAMIAGPVVGGLILTKFGFEVLFIIVSIISLISAIPLFTTREKFEPHKFSYKKSWRRFLNPYNHYKRKDSISYFGYGEEFVAMVAWPIFIFLIIKEFYLMGIIMSVVIISISITSLYVGKLSDILSRKGKRKLLKYSTILLAISWFLRPFALNWLSILLVDIFSKGSKNGIIYPLRTFVYSGGENHKGFLKYIIFYEMSLTAGKMFIAWIIFFISLYISGPNFWFVVFSLAGLWSLLYLSRLFYKKS
ncbi:MAG: MFS transporter [Candidatus Pacebacteria bacterium]|nr:MFS transporter [Candidatus Paceibacterota bacterium]